MRKANLLSIITFSLLIIGQIQAQNIKIDEDNTEVEFYVVSDEQEGTLGDFKGDINFNPENPSKSSIKGSVDVSTISTGITTRDKHLKSSDYFNAEKYPQIKFESTSITATDDGYKMKGQLTIKETTKEITFNFTFNGRKFKAKTKIYGKDFKVGHGWKEREDSKIYIKIKVPVE